MMTNKHNSDRLRGFEDRQMNSSVALAPENITCLPYVLPPHPLRNHRKKFEGEFMDGRCRMDVTQSESDLPDFNQSEH